MAQLPDLTPNAVAAMLREDKSFEPIVQCIGAKPFSSSGTQGGGDRFRLALSDGIQWCTAILATQLTSLVREGGVGNLSVLKVLNFIVSEMQNKRIVIIVSVEVLGRAPQRIGDPKPAFDGAAQQQAAALSNGNHDGVAANGGFAPANGVQQPAPSAQGATFGTGAYGRGTYGNMQGQGNGVPAVHGGQMQSVRQAQGIAGGYGQAPNYQVANYQAGNAPVARNEAAPRIVPIASLNAYQNRWTIQARVSQRSEMRRWHNARGEGKFFSVDFLDAGGGEIRAVCFNDIADQFDGVLQTGKVVLVSKATLKPKKPGSTFNQTRHDHEMTIERGTIIQEVADGEPDAAAIPQILYRFRKIADVESCSANTQLDIVAIVETVGPMTTVTRRDGVETAKRSLTVRDDSGRSIELTLWTPAANDPGEALETMVNSEGRHPLIAGKNLRVGDFNGKNLSTTGSTLLSVDSDHPTALALRDWYDNQGGSSMAHQTLSDQRTAGGRGRDRRCTLGTIDQEQLGTSGQPDYVVVACTVTMLKSENAFYPACSLQYNGRQCNKKLTNADDGGAWWCERCQQQATPDWRYILALQVADHTDSVWLTAFQESGQDIMGIAAVELRELSQTDDKALEAHILSAVHRPLLLKLKIAEETYNSETRVKKTVVRAEKFDFVKESRILIEYIGKLGRGEAAMPQRQPDAGAGAASGAYQAGGMGYGGSNGGYAGNRGAFTPPMNSRPYGQAGGYGGGGYGGQSYGAGGF